LECGGIAPTLRIAQSFPEAPLRRVEQIRAMNLVDTDVYTFNLKHFQVVPGLDVARPYSRG
jgi:hypothetical protein